MNPVAWYGSLAARDRKVMAWGGAAVAALLVIGIVMQLGTAVNATELRVERKRADLAWIESVTPRVQAIPASRANESLAIAVDRTARESGLAEALSGAEPAGAGALRVRFQSAAFDSLALWLARIQQERGAVVESANFDASDQPGRVNAALVLRSP